MRHFIFVTERLQSRVGMSLCAASMSASTTNRKVNQEYALLGPFLYEKLVYMRFRSNYATADFEWGSGTDSSQSESHLVKSSESAVVGGVNMPRLT